jgi:hypothetical protein
MVGFEPTLSGTPSRRIARLSHILSETVPAAGVEPAASAFSARRSYRLSYTGMSKRPWWESNPRHAILQIAASPLDHRIRTEPAVGLEPTSSALRGRCPARRASPASFSSSQCWCRANSTEVQSLRPLPRAWLEVDPEPAAGLEPARAPLQEGVLDPSRCTGVALQGWIAGYDPAPRRSQGRMQPLHHPHHQSALRPVSP